MLRFIFVIILATTATAIQSFCQNTDQSNELSFYKTDVESQTQSIILSDYIQGYNLHYETDAPGISKIKQPVVQLLTSNSIPLPQNYYFLDTDTINILKNGLSPIIVVAYNPTQNKVIIHQGTTRKGYDLPVFTDHRQIELAIFDKTLQELVCFNAVLLDENYTVAFDCQSKIKDATIDTVCLVYAEGGQCFSRPTNVLTTMKKTAYLETMFPYPKGKYLLSATSTLGVSSKYTNNTVINIYKYQNKQIKFIKQVNNDTLGMDTLSITDMTVDSINRVVVSSIGLTSSKIITFQFDGQDIINVKNEQIQGEVRCIAQTNTGTILLSGRTHIIEYQYPTFIRPRYYQLEPTDNEVVQLLQSTQFILVRTSRDNIYIYGRKKTQLKYLLGRTSVEKNSLIFGSDFTFSYFVINSTHISEVEVTEGYLFLSGVTEQKSLSLIAVSNNIVCNRTFSINIRNDVRSIYKKDNLDLQVEAVSSGDRVTLSLSKYFGGRAIRYQVPPNTPTITYSLLAVQQYTQTTSDIKDMDYYQIIGINNTFYYSAGIRSQNLFVELCALNGQKVSCSPYLKKSLQNYSVTSIDGIRRQNGECIVGWTYNTANYQYVQLNSKKGLMGYSFGFHYSSIKIGEKYVFLTMKKQNAVFAMLGDLNSVYIDQSKFSAQQLTLLGDGFYPRQVILTPNNPDIFYVKLTKSIARFGVDGSNVRLLNVFNVIDEFYLAETWSVVVGKDSCLVVTPDYVKQFSMVTTDKLLLHNVDIGYAISPKVSYDIVTDTVYMRADSNKLIGYRLNRPITQSIILETPIKGINFTCSWGWVLIPQEDRAFLVPKFSLLTFRTSYINTAFKYTEMVNVTVQGLPDIPPIISSSSVTVINYPRAITQSTTDNSIVYLPVSASNIQIPIPIKDFFNGSIVSYSISCPFSSSIELLTPFRFVSILEGFSDVDDIGFIVDETIILSKNVVYVLNDANEVTGKTQIKQNINCIKMGLFHPLPSLNLQYTLGNPSVLILCTNPDKQELKHFEIQQNGTLTDLGSFNIEGDHYINNPNSIYVTNSISGKSWVFIYNSAKDISDNRQANIQVFRFSGQQFQYIQQINGHNFSNINLPINGMHIFKNQQSSNDLNEYIAFSLGGHGIVFAKLASPSDSKECLVDPRYIDLLHVKSIQNFTLDTTRFLEVRILSVDANNNVKLFIQSSNAAHLVISFNFASKSVSFNVEESYNRLGMQASYNWVQVTTSSVLLSYYNSSTNYITIGLYDRSSTPLSNLYVSIRAQISPSSLNKNSIGVKKNLVYFGVGNTLNIYDYSKQFSLLANYDNPGEFNIIKVTAKNNFAEVTHNANVSFDKVSNGIKWYVIVIIVAGSLLVIGLGYGCYRKVKSDREKKKISLVTEDGEQNQRV